MMKSSGRYEKIMGLWSVFSSDLVYSLLPCLFKNRKCLKHPYHTCPCLTNLFLEELRLHRANDIQRRYRLEDKATNIITVAGTVTSFVIGFVTFATSTSGYTFGWMSLSLIIASVIAGSASIVISLVALNFKSKQRKTFFVTLLNKTTLAHSLAADEKIHEEDIIERYLRIALEYSKIINQLGAYVGWAFGFLSVSIALIGVALIFTLLFQTPANGSDTYLCKLVEEGEREMTCRILE